VRAFVHSAAIPGARAPVRIFLVFAALALAALAAQRVHAGGLSPAQVEAFYLGGGEGEALSAVAIWEEIHAGAFVYGFVLFMLGSLLAVSPLPASRRRALLVVPFVATLADLFAPFAIVAAGGAGALRVATFAAAMGSVALLLAVVAREWQRAGRGRHG
jgi:hypothetical protein